MQRNMGWSHPVSPHKKNMWWHGQMRPRLAIWYFDLLPRHCGCWAGLRTISQNRLFHAFSPSTSRFFACASSVQCPSQTFSWHSADIQLVPGRSVTTVLRKYFRHRNSRRFGRSAGSAPSMQKALPSSSLSKDGKWSWAKLLVKLESNVKLLSPLGKLTSCKLWEKLPKDKFWRWFGNFTWSSIWLKWQPKAKVWRLSGKSTWSRFWLKQ